MKQTENSAQMQGNRQVGELRRFTNFSTHRIVSSLFGLQCHIKYSQRTDLIFVLVTWQPTTALKALLWAIKPQLYLRPPLQKSWSGEVLTFHHHTDFSDPTIWSLVCYIEIPCLEIVFQRMHLFMTVLTCKPAANWASKMQRCLHSETLQILQLH